MKSSFKRLLGGEAFFYAFFVNPILNSVSIFKKSINVKIVLWGKLKTVLHRQKRQNHNSIYIT